MWGMVYPERPVKPETLGILSLEAWTLEPRRVLSHVWDSVLVGPVLVGDVASHLSFLIFLKC